MSVKLINHRNSHQRAVFRVETSSMAFDENSPMSAISSALDLLEDYWVKFQSSQLNVEEKTSDADLPDQIKQMELTEISYLKTKSILKALLDFKQEQIRDKEKGKEKEDAQNNARDHNVKLPKLKIPTFDGSFSNWSTFRDLFKSMVSDQKTLTDGQKLQYLQPNVFNEAADIVSEYKITDANFDAAWDALEERYENKRLQVKAHLSILFDQEVMTTENAEKLRLLLRTTQKCLRSLKSLGGPIETWDWLLIHMTVIRLDPKTRRYWELTHTTKYMPTWQQLISALENRCNALDSEKSTNSNKVDHKTSNSSNRTIEKKKVISSSSSSKVFSSISSKVCSICNGSHDCSSCKDFLEKNLDGRLELVHKHKLCYKCLKSNHNFRLCTAAKCGKCSKRHHELLHNSRQNSSSSSIPTVTKNAASSLNSTIPSNSSGQSSNQQVSSNNHALVSYSKSLVDKQVLLSTALVKVRAMEGNWVILRAFLDGGAQRHVITEDCVQRLRLKRFSCEVPVTGIGEVDVQLKSCMDGFQLNLNSVVMKSISTDLPNTEFDISQWLYLDGLNLADSKFNEPGNIDLLIGAEFYLSLLKDEPQVKGPVGYPVAQNTHLGWILSGPVVSTNITQSSKIFSVMADQSLPDLLSKFWEIEEIPNISTKSLEDKKCEEHFESTYSRDDNGRFIVKLPFKEENSIFGETRTTALKRFGYLERRFAQDQQLQNDYVDLEKGKFPLRKWISNDETVLESIDDSIKAFENIWNVPFQDSCKALSLRWHPGEDVFGYKFQVDPEKVHVTKRSIMSAIASLYDPLGLLAPTVVKAKILLQNIWRMEVNGDESISDQIKEEWIQFYQNLPDLNDIVVPRWLGQSTTSTLLRCDICHNWMLFVRSRHLFNLGESRQH